MRAQDLLPTTPGSVVCGGTGPFALMIVFPDGNPRTLRRYDTLTEALAAEAVQQAARSRGHLFIVDRDNEERGSLSELDLESCGGSYEG